MPGLTCDRAELHDTMPKSATGSGTVGRENSNGDTLYLYSINYELDDGLVVHHRGDHLKNRTGFKTECIGYCENGYLETHYEGGWIRMLGTKTFRNVPRNRASSSREKPICRNRPGATAP